MDEKQIAFYARSSEVPTEIAERDVVLAYVLRVLADNILQHLAFKGGTYFKKTYFGKDGRFSMDLDFTSVNLSCYQLQNLIRGSLDNQTQYGIHYQLIDENRRSESYFANVRYTYQVTQGSNFELNVSCREHPLLPLDKRCITDELYWKYIEFENFPILCLNKEEALAEKIRAAYQRLRGRDLYDLYLFATEPYDREVVKTLVVIKCWEVGDPFDPTQLQRKIKDIGSTWEDVQNFVRKDRLPTREEVISTVLKNYRFLEIMDDPLIQIIKDSKKKHEQTLVKQLVLDISNKF